MARLWTLDGKELAVFKGHSNELSSGKFSPDGTHVLATAWDGTARLWDLRGNLLAVFQGQADMSVGATFTPDGTRIFINFGDGTAGFWSLDGTELGVIRESNTTMMSAEFSPDGRWILTSLEGATLRLSPARVEDLLAVAACRLPRNFTSDEIVRFGVGTLRFDITTYTCPSAF